MRKVWGHTEDPGQNHDPLIETDTDGGMIETEEETETEAERRTERGIEIEIGVEAETKRREESIKRGMSPRIRGPKVKSMV